MTNTKKLSDFNFTSNPFLSIFGEQSAPSQGTPVQENKNNLPLEQGSNLAPQNSQMSEVNGEVNQLKKGQNSDNLKSLLTASQGLEKFITGSTDKRAIMLARGIMGAIAKLIDFDQKSNLPEGAQEKQPSAILNGTTSMAPIPQNV